MEYQRLSLLLIAGCLPFLAAKTVDRDNEDPTCMLMLENFANFSASFTYCTISHARPITVCQQCVTSYVNVLQVYDDITKIESMGGQKCESELANLDRLQVFESGYLYVKDMWSRANCDNCYVADKKTGFPTTQLTPEVEDILVAQLAYSACVEIYHNTSTKPDNLTCLMCIDAYRNVNDVYSGYKASTGIEFCMDIVDMINSTRNDWSNDFGCNRAQRQVEFALVAYSLGISLLPFVFYFLTYAFTPKKEHTLLERKRWMQDASVIDDPGT